MTEGLVRRINAKLVPNGQSLRRARGDIEYELGQYFIVDLLKHTLVAAKCDPEQLAREMGIEVSEARP